MADRARFYGAVAWVLGIVGLLALGITAHQYWEHLGAQGISGNSDDWGTFGDFVGGIAGTVIALTTLVALAVTLHLQAKELEATRNELHYQSFALGKQNFENTFFHVLRLIEERVDRTQNPSTHEPTRQGRESFVHFVQTLYQAQDGQLANAAVSKSVALRIYRNWFGSNAQHVRAYFQLVFEAVRLVDQSLMQSKQSYADILRALFSPAEQHLLLYHGLSGITDPRMQQFVIRYELLKGFDMTQIVPIPQVRLAWYEAEGDDLP